MTQQTRVEARVAALVIWCAASALSCGESHRTINAVPTAVITRHVVGVAAVTFDNAQNAAISARVVVASSLANLQRMLAAGDTGTSIGGLAFVPITAGEFTVTPGDSAALHFILASVGVRDTSTAEPIFDPSRDNLSFVAVGTSTTFAGTNVSTLLRADGTPESDALAQQLTPTNAFATDGDGAVETLEPATLQMLGDSVVRATELPVGASTILPFAFVVRGAPDFAGLAQPSLPFAGVTAFAFRLPEQAVTRDDPATITVLFLIVNDVDATRTQ